MTEPDETTALLPLPAQGGGRVGFDVVLRGYDRAQVDRHLDWLESELAQARLAASRQHPSFAELGARLVRILELAEEEAISLRSAAASDAEAIRTEALTATQDARAEAERIVGAAHEDAEGVVGGARAEASEILSAARAEAAEIVSAARAEVAELAGQSERIREQLDALRDQLAALLGGRHAPPPA